MTNTHQAAGGGTHLRRLSICIPTYNRSKCLAELLDSIVAQGHPDIEVVVSDDASPDDTPAVVAGYVHKLPNLTFIRQPSNIGLDRNFLSVVEAATGEYVWLFGDDDKLESGALDKVMAALALWPNVAGLTLGVIDYDPEFRKPSGVRSMPPTQLLCGTEAVFGRLAALLGFMSACVVNRQMWSTVCSEDPIFDFENLYIQVYILGRMVARFGTWGVLSEPCVGFRTSNDQFQAKLGWVRRVEVDIIGYGQIADAIFRENPPAALHMREAIFKAHVIARLRNAKMAPGPTPDLWKATKLLFHHYKTNPVFWYSVLPTLSAPKWLLRHARTIYQGFSPMSGAHRARNLAAR